MEKKVIPNKQEFVVMSVDGYKKLANIDYTGKNLYWTTDLSTEIPIKFKFQTPDGEILLPKTIPQCFIENLDNFADVPCCHCEQTPGNWKSYTWKQSWEVCYGIAKSLIALGISKRSSVNIIGFNSVEWLFTFYGAIMADCISVGVYTTNSPSACQYVAEHSSCEIVFAENEKQMNKYLEILDQCPKIKAIIVWGNTPLKSRPQNVKVLTWMEFLQFGIDKDSEEHGKVSEAVNTRIEEQVPGMCCNIVYTSGTTGNPKGVMLTHDNLIFTISRILKEIEDQDINIGQERVVSYLPLSHSAAQVNDTNIEFQLEKKIKNMDFCLLENRRG